MIIVYNSKTKKEKIGKYSKKIKFKIASADLEINDEEIIDIYKRRWDIEQGYKELRKYFGFGKKEKRH